MTYPSDVRAQALALAIQGKTPYRIAIELGIGSHQTVERWLTESPEYPEIAAKYKETLISNAVQIAIESDNLILRGLDHLSKQPDTEIVKQLQTLNIMSGTGKDKVVNFQKQPQAISIDKAIIVIERQQ